MDKWLKIHEFSAYLVPGAIMLYGLLYLFPSGTTFISTTNISIGDLGVFTLLAYSAGHIVQVLGRYIEKWIEACKGDFKSYKKFGDLLTLEQQEFILEKLKTTKIATGSKNKISEKDWNNIFRQMYLHVVNEGKNERIQVFKNHSKVCRGLGTTVLILLPLLLFSGKVNVSNLWFLFSFMILCILSILAMFDRMRGFDKRDAQETYMQFIECN